jgi:hypothetical protein
MAFQDEQQQETEGKGEKQKWLLTLTPSLQTLP